MGKEEKGRWKKEKGRAIIFASFFLFLFSCFALSASAQEYGFLERNIWFSQEPFFAGETVRIYTVVFNGSEQDITGTVEFYDQAEKIGETEFSLAGGGRLRDIWIDWLATEGEHAISARINTITISEVNGQAQVVALSSARSSTLAKIVDGDTDGDKIGDSTDTDNDNDGISDEDERKNGTNPLKADTDGDGLDDKEDPAPLVFNIQEDAVLATDPVESLSDHGARTAANVFAAVEQFRTKYGQGLEDKKEQVKAELDQYKVEETQEHRDQASQRNMSAEQINEAAGENVFHATDEDAGLPKLSVARVLKLIYYGLISIGLFIFERKPVFYAVLGLIFLKFVFIIIGKFRKKRYG